MRKPPKARTPKSKREKQIARSKAMVKRIADAQAKKDKKGKEK